MKSDKPISLDDFFIDHLACLKHMYKRIEAEAREEYLEKQWKDWQEWHALDDESQQFILDYLNAPL